MPTRTESESLFPHTSIGRAGPTGQARGLKAHGGLAFAIGGADGLGTAIIRRADAVLSLGAMTWPHLLARGMLLEQLYRAQQILAGHPYHRD